LAGLITVTLSSAAAGHLWVTNTIIVRHVLPEIVSALKMSLTGSISMRVWWIKSPIPVRPKQ